MRYSALAQSVEHAAVNRRVVGSSPTGGAKEGRPSGLPFSVSFPPPEESGGRRAFIGIGGDVVMYRIMVVEDDDAIAGVLQRTLEKWGYEVRRTDCLLYTSKPLLLRQIECNVAISHEGLRQGYGGEVGRTLLELYGTCCPVQVRAAAAAAAGSDARMNGCPMPVVINSGSGNQGITLTLPVVEYAKELHASSEMLPVSYTHLVLFQDIVVVCGAECAAVRRGVRGAVLWRGGRH